MKHHNKSEGEFTQPDKGKKWGDVELALRYDQVNLNSKDIFGGSAEGYTAGLNFYTARNVKFQLIEAKIVNYRTFKMANLKIQTVSKLHRLNLWI